MNRIGDTLIHVAANEELVRALQSAHVEFVVIGGLAIAWYCPGRKADDMDLLVNPTLENSKRIAQALDGLHMRGYATDSFTKPGLQVPLKQYYYAELLTPQKDGPTFSQIALDSIEAQLFNTPVRLASAETLILLKQRAVAAAENQRDKHLNDIECLKGHTECR